MGGMVRLTVQSDITPLQFTVTSHATGRLAELAAIIHGAPSTRRISRP